MRKRLSIASLAAVTIAVLLLSVGSSRAKANGSSTAAAAAEVKIDNFSFGPVSLTIAAGTTVTWINHDDGSLVYVLNGAAAGSVVGFQWDGKQLRQIPNSTSFLSATSAGGSSVTISPDRKSLVVTERLTNNVDTFEINADGTLAPIVVNASKGPGVFAARYAPDGAVLVSETGPANVANGSAISSYSVLGNGAISAISQSVPTLGAANCWNAISPNGQWVYVSNAGSSTISGFDIGKGGALTPIGGTVVGVNPAGAGNLDIAISSDNGYVYTLNSAVGGIGIFAIQKDGSLINIGQIEGLPKAAGFNGIAAL